ncbi:MAG: UDP-glucuronic acid decarboxylase family protein [Elusimicrobiota bacterium]
MRIVITGGAGFIGSHLCEFLLNKGHKVICIDNLITGNLKNIEDLFKNSNFLFIKQDVTNYLHIPGKVNAVLHFASPASPVDYLKFPIPTLKVGALGTHKALGLAKEKKATFMLASTSEVYGDPTVNPQPESYWGNVNPIGPRGVYDESKRFAESMTMAYHRYHNIPVRIARIFNTYGPKMRKDDGRAVPNFIIQSLGNKPITVYGDGKQTRSFCYITDLIKGLYALMNSNINNPVNLGNPYEITLLHLAITLKKLTKSRSRIIYKPLPVDDPKIRRPDITKAIELLGWKPEVLLEEGLKKTISYFKANLK